MMSARFLRSAAMAGLPFGLAMGLMNGLRYGVASGVGSGVAMGVLFGLVMAWFAERQRRAMAVVADSYEGAPILHQGPANHRRGAEARGGWLVLTSAALHFRSHGVNLSNAPLTVPLGRVREVTPARSLGVIPNGLAVTLDDGTVERFVVSERNAWVEAVRRAMASAGR